MSASTTPWYLRIRWVNAIVLIVLPISFFCLIPWIPPNKTTLLFMYGNAYHSGLCITAGYHRLWSHRSYKAITALQLYLAIFGASAMEGSILWWAREHRAHHRYTDTQDDPYNIKEGFLHAHLLWMVLKRRHPRTRRVEISDLEADPIVMWQSRHYVLLAIVMGWVFPVLVVGLFLQDWWSAILYGAVGKMFIVHQTTFLINSLAHYLGEKTYDDRATPRDSLLAAVLTLGEGYHNFHHSFPSDYRNGVENFHFDCTKWTIALWEAFGLAYDLKRAERHEIERARLQEEQKALTQKLDMLPEIVPLHTLPLMSWQEYEKRAQRGEIIILIGGILHDLGSFVGEHPGGEALMLAHVGKDATKAFHGEVYSHSKVAQNILGLRRVARLHGETEKQDSECFKF